MRYTPWIVGALLLLAPGCGAITGNYNPLDGSTSSFWLPAPKEFDEREWTEATLTSAETGEQKIVALEPSVEPGGLQYVADLEHGFWDVDLTGRDRLSGEPITYAARNVAVFGDEQVLTLERW